MRRDPRRLRRMWGMVGLAALGAALPVGAQPLPRPLAADAVLFQPDFDSNTPCLVNGAGFDLCAGITPPNPMGLVALGTRVWVTDACNERVLGFALTANTGDAAQIGLGQTTLTDRTHRFLPTSEHYQPRAVGGDSDGRVYVGTADGRVLAYDPPNDTGEVAAYALGGVPVDVASIRQVLLGPTDIEALAVVGASDVRFYAPGSSAPYEAYSFESIPCPGAIVDVAQLGDTLFLACEDPAGRCAGLAQIDVPPNNYAAPPNSCSVVYAARIDAAVNLTQYRFPRTDPTYGSFIVPAYAIESGTAITSIAADTTGDILLVTDTGHRMLRFETVSTHLGGVFNQPNPSTTYPVEAASHLTAGGLYGQAGLSDVAPNRGSALPSADSMSFPMHVEIDVNGDAWVLDAGNHRVLRFDDAAAGSGNAAAFLGQGGPSVNLPNRLENISARLVSDVGMSIIGTTVVADADANRVLIFNDANTLHLSNAPLDRLGQQFFNSYLPNAFDASPGGPVIDDQDLSAPAWVAVDPEIGTIYVADRGNGRIVIYDNDGDLNTPESYVGAVAATEQGNTCFVFKAMAARNGTLYVAAGSRIAGAGPGCVDEPRAHRILAYTLADIGTGSDGTPNRVFGQDLLPAGLIDDTLNLENRGGAVGADTLSDVGGLWVDGDNRLWVADTGNHRVLWFDDPNGPDAEVIDATTADGVLGQRDLASNAVAAGFPITTEWGFNGPTDVAVDERGGVFVAVPLENRVLYFPTPEQRDPEEDMPRPSLVLGQSTFFGDEANTGPLCPACVPSASGLSGPSSLAIDASGRLLLVGDAGNNRVLRFFRNAPPRFVDGAGVIVVTEGTTADAPLTMTDPDGDALGAVVIESVHPLSELVNVSVIGSQVSYAAPPGQAGMVVQVNVAVADTTPNPQTGRASLVFQVVPIGSIGDTTWTPRPQPDPGATPSPATGCECGHVSGPPLGLFGLMLGWLLVRRRRR